MHRATWYWLIHNRKYALFRSILIGAFGGSSACVALVHWYYPSSPLWTNGRNIDDGLYSTALGSRRIYATSAIQTFDQNSKARTHTTSVDRFYRKNGKLPKPKRMHDSLEQLIQNDERSSGYGTKCQKNRDAQIDKILVIGDVHGCLHELILLVDKAVKDENHGQPFDAIILTGDLVNKGPLSAEVVKFVREQRGWYTVRGNHDDSALSAALGDEKRMGQAKYEWLQNETLSDGDILWMSELPYTITVPSFMWKHGSNMDDIDTIVVHAGLVPKMKLFDQDIVSMTTIRDVIASDDGFSYQQFARQKIPEAQNADHHIPWTKVWNDNKGPTLIVFGHDAKRKLQFTEYAIGLDTGAVYGGKLTGCILPTKKIVNVQSKRQYCPINS
jgi:bis(5'-nucleosyl)-tetraphosphatase (symmetrical)